MAQKPKAEGAITTVPFDVKEWIRKKDQAHPGFAAAVEAELASLNLEERLRDLRKMRQLTQAQLAKRMGVSQGAIAQMERSEPGAMAIRTLAKMATAMGYALRIDFEPMATTAVVARATRPRAAAKKR